MFSLWNRCERAIKDTTKCLLAMSRDDNVLSKGEKKKKQNWRISCIVFPLLCLLLLFLVNVSPADCWENSAGCLFHSLYRSHFCLHPSILTSISPLDPDFHFFSVSPLHWNCSGSVKITMVVGGGRPGFQTLTVLSFPSLHSDFGSLHISLGVSRNKGDSCMWGCDLCLAHSALNCLCASFHTFFFPDSLHILP